MDIHSGQQHNPRTDVVRALCRAIRRPASPGRSLTDIHHRLQRQLRAWRERARVALEAYRELNAELDKAIDAARANRAAMRARFPR